MSELSFAELFENSNTPSPKQGDLVKATVVSIDNECVWVSSGLKSDSGIPVDQFKDAQGNVTVQVGDEIDVVLENIEDGLGNTVLSREKAKKQESWVNLEKAFNEQTIVTGLIDGKVKGGFTVSIDGIRAFLPGSLVDVRPVRETTHLEGQEIEFKVIKLDQKRNNVVVSRRAVIESTNTADRGEVLNNLEEGQIVEGTVKNLTDYGAFVDLGLSLIHI